LEQIPSQTEKYEGEMVEQPIHSASSENWYKLWSKFTEENNNKENTFNQFRWQNSQIRKHYLVNLDIPINLDEVSWFYIFYQKKKKKKKKKKIIIIIIIIIIIYLYIYTYIFVYLFITIIIIYMYTISLRMIILILIPIQRLSHLNLQD